MSSNVGHNSYKAYLAQALAEGGSETIVYVDRITTLTGEAMATADFSDLSYGVLVINPEGDGSTSYPEFISFTAIDSSAVSFTGCIRGMSSKSASVVTANKRFFPIGTPVTISWGVHSWKLLKDYVDTSMSSFTSFFAPGTAGETVVAGNLVYFDDTDNEWKKCDADTTATVENTLLGIAQGAGVDGGAITDGVLLFGYDDNQTGMTIGALQYASNTAGGISETPGTKEVTLGYSRSATTLYFNPRFNQQLTENQQDLIVAIEGGTDFYAASAVGSDSYAITIAPPITAYATGMKFRFKADVANTGACTLAVSGLSALAIKKLNDQDLITGDIEVGQIVEVVYDGTDFQMQSQTAVSPVTVDIQEFTAAGGGTWTKPSGALSVFVEAWGGGGGGGSATRSASNSAGGGGGGGAYKSKLFKASDLGATETTTVGAGGTVGAQGGNTTFGSLLTAYGGGGGVTVTDAVGGGGGGGGGSAKGSNGSTTSGGGGGAPAGSAALASNAGYGGAGGADTGTGGSPGGSAAFGGGGGGAGRDLGGNSGAGGDSIYGGGGGGGGDSDSTAGAGGASQFGGAGGAGGTNATGTNGTAPGGGGGGGSRNSAGTNAGGTGGDGRIVVTTYL